MGVDNTQVPKGKAQPNQREVIQTHTYSFPWKQVQQVVRKQKVVCPDDGQVKMNYIPLNENVTHFFYKLRTPLFARLLLPQQIEFIDVQTLDVSSQTLVQKGENVSFAGFCTVREEATWSPDKTDISKTIYKKRVYCEDGCWLPNGLQQMLLETYMQKCKTIRNQQELMLATSYSNERLKKQTNAKGLTEIPNPFGFTGSNNLLDKMVTHFLQKTG